MQAKESMKMTGKIQSFSNVSLYKLPVHSDMMDKESILPECV